MAETEYKSSVLKKRKLAKKHAEKAVLKQITNEGLVQQGKVGSEDDVLLSPTLTSGTGSGVCSGSIVSSTSNGSTPTQQTGGEFGATKLLTNLTNLLKSTMEETQGGPSAEDRELDRELKRAQIEAAKASAQAYRAQQQFYDRGGTAAIV